ncbi:3-methyladenine DNA glycosylase [Methyloprofundus sedimenti]|uniref:3-methyladenine DNA glycosylase n=2 Tax=Methyloprofundus sedimenti TaxID=1420851 RepID=A0A1V8M583_9GAMM|nr:3-methyladenine DNA glycosylase [Methyloprofundus sedimenti]
MVINMQSFEQIFQRAVKRKGGEDQLQLLLPPVKSIQEVCLQKDDRILSCMTKCIFQAGFNWKVVENKWPEFEIVFKKFKPQVLELLSAEDLEVIAKDARIIRNMQKIMTVPINAQWINEIADEHGSFAKFIGLWPTSSIVELFKLLKKRGARLGGNTGPRVLRLAGIDSFILSSDVLQALRQADIGLYGSATSMKDMQLIQSAFNAWHKETQLPYTHLSKILAFSVSENIY